jgi:hypothetical protein
MVDAHTKLMRKWIPDLPVDWFDKGCIRIDSPNCAKGNLSIGGDLDGNHHIYLNIESKNWYHRSMSTMKWKGLPRFSRFEEALKELRWRVEACAQEPDLKFLGVDRLRKG